MGKTENAASGLLQGSLGALVFKAVPVAGSILNAAPERV